MTGRAGPHITRAGEVFAHHISSMSEERRLGTVPNLDHDSGWVLTSGDLDGRSFQVSPSESMMSVGLIGDDVSERLRELGEGAEEEMKT